jgi:putative transposase
MMLNQATMSYQIRSDPQHALRPRMRELAASRVRFGYRRLTVLLRREGWAVNAKRTYRLYTEDGLAVRTKVRKKIARRARVPALTATPTNERWSMDFVAARLLDGGWFRVLTVVDQFTRQCVLLLADGSLNGPKAALGLSQAIAERCANVDHGRQCGRVRKQNDGRVGVSVRPEKLTEGKHWRYSLESVECKNTPARRP